MNIPTQKISLRGSLAGDMSRQLQSSAGKTDLLNILDDIFKSNPDIICIPDGGMFVVGKKSERGKFKPDW